MQLAKDGRQEAKFKRYVYNLFCHKEASFNILVPNVGFFSILHMMVFPEIFLDIALINPRWRSLQRKKDCHKFVASADISIKYHGMIKYGWNGSCVYYNIL